MWTWPDGWGKRPDGTLLPILSLAITKEDKESEELMETGLEVTIVPITSYFSEVASWPRLPQLKGPILQHESSLPNISPHPSN